MPLLRIDDYMRESVQRAKYPPLPYGIKFLDQYLYGIGKELVLIGAESGIGKTEIATMLALNTAKAGKRVAGFFLEGDKYELADRIKWRLMYQIAKEENIYWDSKTHNYARFHLGLLKESTLEMRASEQAIKMYQNMLIFDKNDRLNKDNFTTEIESMSKDLDLIVVDHLHYFDMFSTEENETRQISELMRALMRLVEHTNVPIVLVSHLKKKKDSKQIVPDQDSFKGSSSIYQEAGTCIIISPHFAEYNYQEQKYPTFMHLAKSRVGAPKRLVGSVIYDNRSRQYEDKYTLYRVRQGGEAVEPVDDTPVQTSLLG